jgi:YD repeat-containing protein
MRAVYIIVVFMFLNYLNFSCSSSKKFSSLDEHTHPLIIDPYNYHKVNLNPNWIAANEISQIIEREYLDGRNGKIHLITILDYDKEGYITTKYNGLGYPNSNIPDKSNIFSKEIFENKLNKTFVEQSSKIIIYPKINSDSKSIDTIFGGWKIYNRDKSKEFRNIGNEIITSYEFDLKNRLVKEISADGKELFEILYHAENKIEIKQYSSWFKGNFSSWITIDTQGQIISVYDESNKSTHEFKYDKLGFMIEDKHWFQGKEPNYHVYEYIKKSS